LIFYWDPYGQKEFDYNISRITNNQPTGMKRLTTKTITIKSPRLKQLTKILNQVTQNLADLGEFSEDKDKC
jgi:hypothetical protein